ncbi:hypothetical protein [Staphylococcus pseudintermedius]|uniref:hypothetical protein n=1 Tax=Staphylococcus pseudintermedius TaxID=283734 RepID=UPI000D96D276|nr:hypothetical protein [Staphylococcus pseudintermedius]EGQ1780710.1 hypothetical protein [Staphylococcus pseudintermedius]EGQ2911855.1 hypothetical protein [Staphylococcus pseudintermedius]EGQ4317663.1 hypothetical protein [Staphylococcus pseudintermedius]EGQ4442192.1 hypothetical protein [Staphylococcus pseudintermedius]EHT3415922.1 hypothetical protein [Staphylococcus pseudintermedius]
MLNFIWKIDPTFRFAELSIAFLGGGSSTKFGLIEVKNFVEAKLDFPSHLDPSGVSESSCKPE